MKKLPRHLKLLKEHKETPIDWSKDRIVSYSQYSTWKQCPHKWKLQNVDKLKNPPSIELSFGKAMHTTIQHYLKIMYDKSAVAADKEDILGIFESNLREEYRKGFEQNNKIHFSTAEEMAEYFEDGRLIIETFIKKRSAYFSSRKTWLIGIEFPLSFVPHEKYPNVKLKGFIDFILYNENTEKFYIYDAKTSRYSWGDDKKKDKTLHAQLIFYKYFLHKQFSIPIENIEVEFFIMKRKIWEESEFPQSRIQQFFPSSGKINTGKAVESLRNFIESCFAPDGSHLNVAHIMTPSSKCKFCHFFNQPKLCDHVKTS